MTHETSVGIGLTLRAPTLAECQQVLVWRDHPSVLGNLRTGSKTETEQTRFYEDVVVPADEHVYRALHDGEMFIGLGGLTYLHRWPDEGELSLLIGPEFQGLGYGRLAVDALLTYAFETLGLEAVVGESYRDTPGCRFWADLAAQRGWFTCLFGRSLFFRILPLRHLEG